MSARRTTVWLTALTVVGLGLSLTLIALAGGARHGGDTPRYLAAAESLLAGEGPRGKTSLYVGYVALLAAFRAVGLGPTVVTVVQATVAAASAFALFDLGRAMRGTSTGLVAMALYVGYLDLVRWHGYVLTDSLFTSAVVVSIWAVHRAVTRGGRWRWAALAALSLMASIRPNGWIVAVVAVTYWVWHRTSKGVSRRAAVGAVLVGAALAVTFGPPFQAGIEEESPARMLRQGAVVWGDRSTWVDMPASTVTREGTLGIVGYALEHPAATAGLFARRVVTELAQVRGTYSWIHNAYVALVVWPTYAFALWGSWARRRVPLTWLLVAVVGAQMTFVGLTFADYDGRFLTYVLPPVMLLAASGVTDVRDRWMRERG